jgi:hypothetical protein
VQHLQSCRAGVKPLPKKQGCGSGLNPDIMTLWIRIRNLDPWAEKKNEEKNALFLNFLFCGSGLRKNAGSRPGSGLNQSGSTTLLKISFLLNYIKKSILLNVHCIFKKQYVIDTRHVKSYRITANNKSLNPFNLRYLLLLLLLPPFRYKI